MFYSRTPLPDVVEHELVVLRVVHEDAVLGQQLVDLDKVAATDGDDVAHLGEIALPGREGGGKDRAGHHSWFIGGYASHSCYFIDHLLLLHLLRHLSMEDSLLVHFKHSGIDTPGAACPDVIADDGDGNEEQRHQKKHHGLTPEVRPQVFPAPDPDVAVQNANDEEKDVHSKKDVGNDLDKVNEDGGVAV